MSELQDEVDELLLELEPGILVGAGAVLEHGDGVDGLAIHLVGRETSIATTG